MSDRHDLGTDAGAYALNALEKAEREAYEAFLAADDDARAEAAELADTAAMLSATVPTEQPSPALRASILEAIASTPQLTPGPQAPVLRPAASDRGASRPDGADQRAESPAERKARVRWSRPAVVAASAAAAVALFVGGTALGTSLAGGDAPVSSAAAELATINASSDAQRAAAEVTGGGTATLVWSADLGKSVFLADGIAAPPEGKTYELWYIRDGVPLPAGTFDPAKTTTWRVLEGEMREGDVVGVTIEDRGGSSTGLPTTDPVVAIPS